MFPSGRLFVRCGWVADTSIEAHFTPFLHTDGPFALGHAKDTALQQSLRLQPGSSSFGEEGGQCTVQVNITNGAGVAGGGSWHAASAPGSPSKHQTADALMFSAAYSNPLAYHTSASAASGMHGGGGAGGIGSSGSSSSPSRQPTGGFSPTKAAAGRGLMAGGGIAVSDVMVGNPLAHLGEDVEVGQTLAPPMPPLKADRALQRVAQGAGHKVGDSYRMPWCRMFCAHFVLTASRLKTDADLELLTATSTQPEASMCWGWGCANACCCVSNADPHFLCVVVHHTPLGECCEQVAVKAQHRPQRPAQRHAAGAAAGARGRCTHGVGHRGSRHLQVLGAVCVCVCVLPGGDKICLMLTK